MGAIKVKKIISLFFTLILLLITLSGFNVIASGDGGIVPSEIKVNKEPPSDAVKTKELVSAVILDKYTRNLTWAERPENFKEICSIEKYPNPILREQCQIDILEYKEVEAPFVKIKIKYLEALKKDTEEDVDCLVYLGRGISASENEDFTNLKVGESYEGTYFIRKSSKNWTRFIELGDEYCEFEYSHGLVPFLGKAGNTMNKILRWIVNLFK